MEETAEIYDPSTQVVRSEQTSEEEAKSKGATTPNFVGTASNLDNGNNSDTTDSTAATEDQTKSQSTINYEISKTVRHSIKQAGKINKLSVAVVIEGSYTGEGADRQYVPVTDSQLVKIKALVKSAIGFDESRGDVVEVVDLPFTEIEQLPEVEEKLFTNKDILKIIEYVLMLIGFVVMVLFVIKPILSTANVVVKSRIPERKAPTLPMEQASASELSSPDEVEDEDLLVDVTNVEGKVREASIKKAANIIENHPEESTQVIRRWMLGDIPDDKN
jgi:flagellar M-ring protein FliF